MPITGDTRLVGVIGDPVRHSLSPAIHNEALRRLELNWRSLAFEVAADEAAQAMQAVRVLGLRGLSVTMPHKAAVVPHLDRLAPSADALGVVNCVSNEDGELVGHNTDGDGFVAAIGALGVSLGDGAVRFAILGAGGAARSIVEALGRSAAADIAIINRTAERAESCAALAGVARVGGQADLEQADVIVNTTSVGMGTDRSLPMDGALLRSGQTVVDIIYEPAETMLLTAAKAAGATTMNGLPMLVHQAVVQLELWTGRECPAEPLLAAAQQALDKRSAGAG